MYSYSVMLNNRLQIKEKAVVSWIVTGE